MWIISSVALSILFRLEVRRRFDGLCANISPARSGILLIYFAKLCDAAKIVVQAFDQAPIRLNPRPGFLCSLIASAENHWWWFAAAAEAKAFWRRVDAVFVVQTIIAAIAWILAIIADFWR